MRVAVMGAGGIGGYFGGLLARAGHDVAFIARGEHLRAIQERGLRVESVASGDFTVHAQATSDPDEVGEVDLVLLSVKAYHNAQAIPALSPLLGPDTAIMSMENGLGSGEELTERYGAGRVLLGPTLCEAYIQEPGVVVERMPRPGVVFGELRGGVTERVRRLALTLAEAGWRVEVSGEVEREAWFKCMFMCATGAVLAVTRSTLGEVLGCPESRDLYLKVLREVDAVARARGNPLDLSLNIPRLMGVKGDDAVPEAVLRFADQLPPAMKSSTLRDVEAGRPLEIDAMNGAVHRLGWEVGVPTPTNEFLYACLKPAHLRALVGG